MSHTRRILAIDPGYGRMGIAVLERIDGHDSLLFSECFETQKESSGPNRLLEIRHRIRELIEHYRPSALAIESLFFGKNKKTALAVAESRGIVLSEAAAHQLEIFEYKPVHVKIAITGHGGSDKRQVQSMVERILRLDKKDSLDDEYDAIAVGLTHLATSPTTGP